MSNPIKREEIIGDCRLLLGDCLEILPLLGKVDAVVTDPPYGIGFPYNSYDDTPEALAALISGFVPLARGMSTRVVVTPGNTNLHRYPPPEWTGAWTWDTTTAYSPIGFSQWQPILFYGSDPASGFESFNGALRSDRIHFTGGQAKISHAEGKGHTCPKPVEFIVRLVNRFTNSGDRVLDCFMGSGTTGVACVKLGRAFTGIEIDEAYFDIACSRIEKAYAQPDFFVEAPKQEPAKQGEIFGDAA